MDTVPMAERKRTPQRFDDAFRQAVKESGLTPYWICKDAGITTDSLYRFLAKERELRFDSATSIAQALGLRLAPIGK